MSILRVREAFACDWNGTPHVFRPGDLVDHTDKVTKGREVFFEPVEVTAARAASRSSGVEQATAAPGEKRSRTRAPRVRKAAAKKASAPPAKVADTPAPAPDVTAEADKPAGDDATPTV